MNCRFCNSELTHTFVDLGMSPLSNSFIKAEHLSARENFYPLHAYVCEECFLVQLGEFESPEQIFSDYMYFSSYSSSWLEHAKTYCTAMLGSGLLPEQPYVVEIASNDGYLLQYFKEQGIEVLGIEPARNVAQTAIHKGIPTISEFFGVGCAQRLAQSGKKPNLITANNVLAHVPDINDFVEGFRILLDEHGILTVEFPHLLNLIRYNQFDTIYHEHFSYLSLITTRQVFERHGLKVFRVEKLPTHGGSLRLYITHCENDRLDTHPSVAEVLDEEKRYHLDDMQGYRDFNKRAQRIKQDLLRLLIAIKQNGKTVAAYGAAAKGNTLLNYCGIRGDFIDYIVDNNPVKQNLFTPGTHIPVCSPDRIKETKPDYLLILPWNLKTEIMQQADFIRIWGGKFILPIPKVEVVE